MTDPSKKVNNPLFSASVTGVTLEDVSQNALLLPAQEKPAAPLVQVSYDNVVNTNTTPFLEPTTIPEISTQIQSLEISPSSQNIQQAEDKYSSTKSTSSVFSSFSNILKTGFTNTAPQQIEQSVEPPAGIGNLISDQSNCANVPAVPLYPVTAANTAEIPKLQGPPPQTSSVNTYRRSGLKRPTYAQVPGLTNSSQPAPSASQQFQQTQNNLSSTYFQPIQPVSPASSIASTSSTNDTNFYSSNHFKPISPLPPSSNNNLPHIAYPQATVSSVVFQPIQEPLSFVSNNTNNTGPLMASISPSEVLETPVATTSTYQANSQNSFMNTSNQIYRPVYNHWFYKRDIEGKAIWKPFSTNDSLSLEHAFTSNDLDPDKVIPTDGTRYDVNILRRQRIPVYWKGKMSEVRRCSWFYKANTDSRYTPYEENIATKLEEEYKIAFESNQWHRKVELPSGESIVFHAPDVLVLFPKAVSPDAWGNTPTQLRPRIVKRGLDDIDIDEGEPIRADHILFMVHGIGSVCDLKFRTVEEVVDDFRLIGHQLIESHYRTACENGIVNKVEILPISWHDKLHSEETGIDNLLKNITLDSIPKLRDFTNDTILDVLFYTSPFYCQTIISTVGNELNRVYGLYKMRNPSFSGGVSLGGHSLGSLILFDLLSHQHSDTETAITEAPEENLSDSAETNNCNNKPNPEDRKINRRISYMMGAIGTGQPQMNYPALKFAPSALFALGSPIGMFVTVRGLDSLGEHFSLPTCPAFFNIFHPYDPVAYRIEALINPQLAKLKPVLIPHHKGRKRMHLELKETMARVGADLKQRVFDSMKSTWNSFYQLAMFHKQDAASLEEEVNKAIQSQLEVPEVNEQEIHEEAIDIPLGNLNKGRRVDFVLQEAPFEIFNEYIFALTSHVCYWDSEDTMLLMLKEIYSTMGISTDSKVPQQSMTIERPLQATKPDENSISVDPTIPINQNVNLAPPPTSGFIRKT